jgi:hypothetical protein
MTSQTALALEPLLAIRTLMVPAKNLVPGLSGLENDLEGDHILVEKLYSALIGRRDATPTCPRDPSPYRPREPRTRSARIMVTVVVTG